MEDDRSQNQSLFPLEKCPQVTDEAFNLFHSIDRQLYTRLIHNLGRDTAESVQVMAFWMWLEREYNNMNLIRRMLSLPPVLLNELADETTTCLKCVEVDMFQNGNEITLLPELLSSPVVSLRFFHENRVSVVRGVTKIINTVCARAFNDIWQRAWRGKAANVTADGGVSDIAPAAGVPVQFMGGVSREVGESSREAERRSSEKGPIMPLLYNPYVDVPFVPFTPAVAGGLIQLPPPPGAGHIPPPAAVADAIGLPIQMLATGSFSGYDFAEQRQMMRNELGDMLSKNLIIDANANHNGDQEQEVPPDDRTIFLTFSKGYPTSEDEVREFFTRRFGDFIEELIMQEVGEEEQVLYAKMVVKMLGVGVIDVVVGGSKAKYSINGKHVWARKYVKKQQQSRSPPRGGDPSSSTSTSTSSTSQAVSCSPSTSAAHEDRS